MKRAGKRERRRRKTKRFVQSSPYYLNRYEIQKSRISVFNDSGRGRNSLSIERSESPTSVFCFTKAGEGSLECPG
ncbi:hypothetical protein CEXT_511941 [Caerostris extrusa]|uniref:Uncharacterized protein n=1 Tax=Caerostris extrusa TaxID=172846 RepID=A0AAV4NR62_CAEEX|nr:hypothetical protein CEXT_511941 [Caerostris extrusa]